jgi:tetratricopeptide (TPR) repeat protein
MVAFGLLAFALQWGKYRLGVLSKRRPAWLGLGLAVAGLFVIGDNKTLLTSAWVSACIGGVVLAGFVGARIAGSVMPQVRLDRALLEMKEWTRYNYAHLRKLPEKGIRPNDRRACGTLADLRAAISFLKKDTSFDAQLKLAIAQLESGLMHRMMNVWGDAAAELDASIARLEQMDRERPSDTVLDALGIKWPTGQVESCQSSALLAAIDQSFIKRVGSSTYPGPGQALALRGEARHRLELVRSLAAAAFRRAELYHVLGDANAALSLYARSLAIYEQLNDADSGALIRKLMSVID